MANWNLPTISSGYLDFVTEMNAKFVDAVQMMGWGSPTNVPSGAMRWNRSINIFEEWDGATWNPKTIAIAGGGTGSNNAAGARINLGLGSMSTQNSNAVNITGGSITGVQYSAADITSGVLALARGGTGNSLAIQGPGQVLLSNGTNVVFDSGINIAQLNANNLVGAIPVNKLPITIAYRDIVNQFVVRQRISNAGGDWPRITMIDMNAAVDNKIWEINIISGGSLNFWALNDGESSVMAAISLGRNGHISAAGLGGTPLNAGNLIVGTVPIGRLGTGTPDASTFLRGDNIWAVPPTGGGGTGTPIPSGMISMFANGCPAGWTRVAQFDNRFPMGGTSYGQQGGNSRHSHSFSVNTNTDGNHSHSFSANVGGARAVGSASGNTGEEDNGNMNADSGNSGIMARASHKHFLNININIPVEGGNVSGDTSLAGNHYHQVTGNTTENDQYPPYTTVFFCQKD